jgi:hypothetical protein
VQLELFARPNLAELWKRYAKKDARDAKKAAEAGTEHTPASQSPQATFIPSLIDEFLEVFPVTYRSLVVS